MAEPKTIEKQDEDGETYQEQIETLVQSEDGKTLTIHFEYRPADKKDKQDQENARTIAALKAQISDSWAAVWEKSPTDKNPDRTLLEKHLSDYTQKNTADYFIHKDLGGFLRRELDFYIKNEVMHLDNIQHADSFEQIKNSLRQIQVLREIAHDIITFLAQLEDFQKKLWLKKKFVAQTHYLITLDKIPAEMLPETLANPAQQVQWKNLFDINELERFWGSLDEQNLKKFQQNQPHLVVDTSLYPPRYQQKLLTLLTEAVDLDANTDGVLIHSDNFQALNLLQARYREQVKCIYIDPPFNLEKNGDFLYKTEYKDSSWLTLLDNRLILAKKLLSSNGFLYLRCDHNGNYIIKNILNNIFDKSNFEGEILVKRIRKNITSQGRISLPLSNDSLFLYRNSDNAYFENPYLKLKEKRESYWRRMDDSAGFRNPPERNIFGAIFKPYKYDAHFKFSQKSIEELIKENRVRLVCKNCKYTHYSGEWNACPSCGKKDATPQYLVLESDKQVLDTNWMDISGYAHTTGFSTENAEVLLDRAIDVTSTENNLVMDFFLGSGTTVISALKNNRKWIGIEQSESLESIVVPRIYRKLVEYEKTQIVKVLKLESYEDTLNNIVLKGQDDFLKTLPENVREEYLLRYLLDTESKAALLNSDDFRHPFDYRLNIATDSAGAYQSTVIDLIETFNYLLGIRVQGITDEREKRAYVTVEGILPNGERALIVWRDVEKMGYAEVAEFFDKHNINPHSEQYDVVYLNGDHDMANRWQNEDNSESQLNLRAIEPEFLNRMFTEKGE
ncbi:DNA methyltransferase [Avibacterium avium]|uniref:DNA methyltransferase n=1 Tax=Avibacterium avium TaxID=751 RepID=UPI001C499EC9|nr:site-specific DNA-methyltransferase [Avibacterium avium]